MSMTVPPASAHVEVTSAEATVASAEAVASGDITGTVVLVRRPGGQVVLAGSPGSATVASAGGAEVKYTLTGMPGALPNVLDGSTCVRSPDVYAAGESVKARRARQILKKRMALDVAQTKYIKRICPEPTADGAASVAPPNPVMICEPEAGPGPRKGRTLFFVAKPPSSEEKGEAPGDAEDVKPDLLPSHPAGRDGSNKTAAAVEDATPNNNIGVLKTLQKYQLSEKYEILPPPTGDAAEEVIHKLRCQNLSLKTELVNMAIDGAPKGADVDTEGLAQRRGRKKPTAILTVDRLRELEKIEAGMHSLFTPSQVKTLSREYKKNSVQWKLEDFRRALGLLEASSLRAFNYVRKEMMIPLPSIGTLKLRCPQHPELNQRFEAVLRAPEPRCRSCGASQAAEDDHQEEMQLHMQQQQDYPPQQQCWNTLQPTTPRKRKRDGIASAAKKVHHAEQQDYQEPAVYFEDQLAVERSPAKSPGRGRGRGRGKRAARPPPLPPRPEPDEYGSESMSDDEMDDEYDDDSAGRAPDQTGYTRYPPQYAGWTDWDPRQLQ